MNKYIFLYFLILAIECSIFFFNPEILESPKFVLLVIAFIFIPFQIVGNWFILDLTHAERDDG